MKMATSLVPLVLLARQSGTASAAGETAAYVEGAAREAGETPPRWIRFLYWRYSIVKGVLQVCLQVCRLLQLYIYRVACMVKKQSRVGLGF